MGDENVKKLIDIILYFILAFAFFSSFTSQNDTIQIDVHLILIVFIFGVLSVTFLYLGMWLENKIFKFIGYYLTGGFISVFSWFIFKTLALTQDISPLKELFVVLKKKSVIWGLIIPLICLISYKVIYLVIKKIRDKKN